ncbi:MAG: hypothetical protein LBH07_08295 [Treponema sp.]|jgi:MOSC domain-containing protein YiiM|nr:hypothetical protein [Treponema sp.]
MTNGIVNKIQVFTAKGEAGTEMAEARLVENLGIEGDFHAKGGKRQIALLFTEIRKHLRGSIEQGLCFSRYKENIAITGFTANILTTGTRLLVGEAVLEVTGETKHCHEECTLYEAGKLCSLAGLNLFAMVIKSGIIRIGDRITVLGDL